VKRPSKRSAAKLLLGCLGFVFIAWLLWQAGWVREWTVRRAGGLGPWAVPFLRDALDDEDHLVSGAACDALLAIGEDALPRLLESLDSDDAGKRARSAKAISVLGVGGKDAVAATRPLIRRMHDPDPVVRLRATQALWCVGPDPREAVPAFLAALSDPDAPVRAEAAEGLGRLASSGPEAVAALARALKDPDANVRAEAAEALQKVGPAARDAVPALSEALKDSDERVREEAAEALEGLNRPPSGEEKRKE
jgi:HEAT repeats/HEAT repeat